MLFLSKWQHVIIMDYFLPMYVLSNSTKNLYLTPILSAVSKIILSTVMCDVMQNVKRAEAITKSLATVNNKKKAMNVQMHLRVLIHRK